MISANAALPGSYDYGEVARSVLIAIAASYAALDLAGRVTAAKGRIRLAWLSGGAIAMGIGIWAMHFKGMLAFHLPVPVKYHWPTVLASLLVAILASAVALYVTSRQRMSRVEAVTGSVIMGGAIAGMHYIGMAAMRLPAIARYSPLLVTCSILLAILFSLIALLMAFGLREEARWSVPRRLGSAIVMGAAVSAMHYTGMAAASFFPATPPSLFHSVSIPPLGNYGVFITTLIVLVAAIATSSVDRRASAEIQRLNQELERRVAERTSQLEALNQALRKEIAERERAEDAVRRSEEHLRLVIDTVPAMLHSARPDGYLDFFNKRWLEYLGVSLDDLLGWRWTSVIHPDDLAQLVDKWQTSLASGRPFETEARLRRADGEYRLTLHRKVPLRDEAGNIVKWYGSVIDIEDRKRAEQELRQAEEHIRAILEYSPNWIFLKDTEGRYLLVNREIERVFGISQEQIKGKTDSEIFPPEQAPEYRANDLKVLRAGLTMEFEEIALLEDGPHTSIVHKFPLFDTHGNIYAIGGVATDITERKRAEEARRYSEEQYRTVVETATDAVISMNESGSILLANPATARIFGYDPAELIGKPLTVLMPEFMRKLHESGFRRYLATGQRHLNWQGTELTALRKNGQEFPVELSFGEMISNGHRVFTGFVRDISEKKRSEDELRRQKEVFQKIFENIPVTISFIGKDGRLELVNPEWERTLGWTLEEIRKQNPDLLAEFYPDPQYRQRVLDLIAASTGEWADRKVRVRNGRVIDLAVAFMHLSDGTSIAIGRDITEHKRAEEAQLRLAAIVRSSDDAIISKDLDGVITSWNAGAQRIFGYTEAEAVGRPITLIVPPELRDEESLILRRLRAGEYIRHFETVRITKQGARVDVSLTISPMKDSEGRVVGASKIARDITERKRGEEELRKQKEVFQKIFENIPVMIVFLDPLGAHELINPEWERTIGWTSEEIRQQNLDVYAELFPDPQYRQMVRNLIAASAAQWIDLKVRTRDGRVLDVAADLVDLSDGWTLGIGRDITAQKRAEAELRESEARFRLVADSAPVMIWMSGTDKLSTYFNKPWLDFTGRSLEQDLGNGWAEGVHPEDLRRCMTTYVQAFDRREAFRMEYRLRRHDGEFRWVLDIGVPRFNPDGSFAGYIGSCIDVTERRRAEEQLRQAHADLARVTRMAAMGELAATIAHEVNQPLGAVVTNASASLRWLAVQPANLEETREAIERTVREATRASDVIRRIRALLQKGPPQMERLDVNAVIREVLILAGNEILRGGVAVQTDLALDLPNVLGDRVQLQQVLLNLILNGIEAMSTVTDRPRDLLIRSVNHPDGVLIQVHDSGVGVDPEQADRIFEAFFTTKPQGIGMGLSVGRSIVEVHGGRLWFTPGSSHGVVFQFTVPKADTSDERAA
jgi:PAS domain S-box-containing protein